MSADFAKALWTSFLLYALSSLLPVSVDSANCRGAILFACIYRCAGVEHEPERKSVQLQLVELKAVTWPTTGIGILGTTRGVRLRLLPEPVKNQLA